MWHLVAAGQYPRAAVLIAPVAIPLGLAAGGAAWAGRRRAMESAAGGAGPRSAIAFDQRQWRHQVRSARARIAAPGAVPLITGGGDVLVGSVIRAVGHRARELARLPYSRLRSHQVVIGGTGTGKTTLLLRLWAAFMATALRRHAAGLGEAPLLVVLDCKGGGDARRIADRARRVLREAGARTTAIWPDEASLSLWALPTRQLITTLADLVEHGTGGAAYYADVLDAVVALAVGAPGGPPVEQRGVPGPAGPRLADAGLPGLPGRAGPDPAGRPPDRRRGAALPDPVPAAGRGAGRAGRTGRRGRLVLHPGGHRRDGRRGGPGPDADRPAGQPPHRSGPGRREVLLAVDEFSAVSRRLPIWALYERARSLGLAVQVSAQSWHGLAPDEADRYRIVSAAEGGIWLLRTPHPEPVTELAGQRRVVVTTRRLLGYPRWSRAGSSEVREAPVADPALIRALDVGQAAYLYRGGVTFVQISRLVGQPAALGPAGVTAGVTAEVSGTGAAGVAGGAARGRRRMGRPRRGGPGLARRGSRLRLGWLMCWDWLMCRRCWMRRSDLSRNEWPGRVGLVGRVGRVRRPDRERRPRRVGWARRVGWPRLVRWIWLMRWPRLAGWPRGGWASRVGWAGRVG